MRVVLTGHGKLAQAFLRADPAAEVYSFRSLDDQAALAVAQKADVVIHNAASTDLAAGLPRLTEDNFLLTKRIVDLIRTIRRPPRLINIGSMSYLKASYEYLDPVEMGDYACSKFMGEIYCLRELPESVSVRFSTLFYKSADSDGLSRIVSQAVRERRIVAYNRGEQRRDILPLDTAAQYLRNLAEKDIGERRVNLCSGREERMSDLIAIVAAATGAEVVNREVADNRFVLSRFSDRDIVKLGKLDFSLAERIDAYVRELAGR